MWQQGYAFFSVEIFSVAQTNYMTFQKEMNEYGLCNCIAIMNSFIIIIVHGEFNDNLYLTGNCKDSVGHCPTMNIMNLCS